MSKKDRKSRPQNAPSAVAKAMADKSAGAKAAAGKPATSAVDETSELPPSRTGTVVVWSLIGTYVAVYMTVSLIKWFYFLYDDFDLAIYAQACRQAVRGSLYSPILDVNLLGNHMSLLILPIAPIYALMPSPVTLLALQTVVLALGALPVYWLARREIQSEFIAVACAALYLLYPALGYSNLYQFHPETLTATTLLFAFYFLRTGRLGWMTLFAVISLMAKEDVPLVVGAMGLYALTLNRPRRWVYSVTLIGLGLAFFILAFAIVMPAVNRGEVQMQKIYTHWGPTTGPALVAMAKDPVRVAKEFFTTPVGAMPQDPYCNDPKGAQYDTTLKLEYYLQMLLPVTFLALLSPLTLAIALPAVAQHLLSRRESDHTIVYHYAACVTPFVFAAAVLGMRNLLSLVAGRRPGPLPLETMNARTPARSVGWILTGVALVTALTCQFLFGPVFGFGVLQSRPPAEAHWPSPETRARASCMRAMLARVPDGPVAAGFRFLPHVVDRPVTYSVHHVYTGRHTMSDKPYEIPRDVVALALDADSTGIFLSFTRWDGGGRLRELLDVNRLAPADSADDSVLFLRDAQDPVALFGPGEARPANRRRVTYDGQLTLLGWDTLPASASAGGRLELRTHWMQTGRTNQLYLTQFKLQSQDGRAVLLPPRRIGYTIWPVHDWPSETAMAETYRLVLPADARSGTWSLAMRVIGDDGRGMTVAAGDDASLEQTRGFVELGQFRVGPP